MNDSGSNWKTAVGGGALLALLASNIYLFVQIHDMKTDAAKQNSTVESQIADLRDSASNIAATSRKRYEEVSENLQSTRRQAVQAASSVKTEALSKVEQTRKQLEDEQAQAAEKINTDLSQTKQETAAKLDAVNADVGTVKTQVISTRTDLDKTISQLTKVQGDLGVTSGYVATNGKELSALKRLNERNYFEFTLAKGKNMQKVGDIQVALRKTDPKHNKFTVTVLADDKTIEKKDKTVNEPVQFYVAKARQPYEIVVNEVRKDAIVGYLATPKDVIAR